MALGAAEVELQENDNIGKIGSEDNLVDNDGSAYQEEDTKQEDEVDLSVYGIENNWRPCCMGQYKTSPIEVELTGGWMRFNPVVFFMSIILIWGFVGYCAGDPENAEAEIGKWQTWIVANFTWLYIFAVGFFGIFDAWICCSKYGDIVLGEPGQPPRFSTATWFSMLFSAGIGIGLFFWGVAEPVAHYAAPWGVTRWSGMPRHQRAIQAMNVSWFHWGLAPSACYCIVGLPLAYLQHVKKMPCTMRTIFYPLLGRATWGIIGDVIDIFAVLGTMFGVGTSLGLGCIQMATGLNRLSDGQIDDGIGTQSAIIWVVTAFATVSVMTGLDYGIRRLSEGNFTLGIFVTGILLFMGNTWFILSVFIETAGNHVWALLDLEFHTDAFQTLPDIGNQGGEESFMSWWTVFYWGWWISWAPFVGVFIAQISKGRTVREFIIGNMFVPTLMTSAWLTIYGGLGLEMEMEAEYLGIGGNRHALWPETADDVMGYNVQIPQTFYNYTDMIVPEVNPTTGERYNVSQGVMQETMSYDPARYNYAWNVAICGDMPVNEGTLYRLSCRSSAVQLFDVIYHYDMADFVATITIIAIVTYFVTSSDSGSHVIDMMCANGDEEPPMCQRIFWAVSEGAVAYFLLQNGGDTGLGALQTASIAAGLPFCIIMIGMVFSTLKIFSDWELENPDGVPKYEQKKPDGSIVVPTHPWQWKLLQAADYAFTGAFCPCCARTQDYGPYRRNTLDFCMAIFTPCLIQQRINQKMGDRKSVASYLAAGAFLCWIIFEVCEVAEDGLAYVGWLFYTIFAILVSYDRFVFRDTYDLDGSGVQDCCQVFFCYPCALLQVLTEVEAIELSTEHIE